MSCMADSLLWLAHPPSIVVDKESAILYKDLSTTTVHRAKAVNASHDLGGVGLLYTVPVHRAVVTHSGLVSASCLFHSFPKHRGRTCALDRVGESRLSVFEKLMSPHSLLLRYQKFMGTMVHP